MARTIWLTLLAALLAGILIILSSYGFYCGNSWSSFPHCAAFSGFPSYYSANLRASLFTGFFTLGGFMLSLKTFIIVNMKKEVFENEKYIKEWTEQKLLDKENKLGTRFAPLQDLSTALFSAIVACVLTSTLQMTLGLTNFFWAAVVCMWSALAAVFLLAVSLWLIRKNLNRMFHYLDGNTE